MTSQLFLGLDLEPTVAMRNGEQLIWQCVSCGSLLIQSSLVAERHLAACPACQCATWSKQRLPIAGLAP